MRFLEATIWLTKQRQASHGLTVSFTVMADWRGYKWETFDP